MFTLTRNGGRTALAALAAFAISSSALAEDRLREELAKCRKIPTQLEKLDCYEKLSAPESAAASAAPKPAAANEPWKEAEDRKPDQQTNLANAWRLDEKSLRFDAFLPYRPTYFIGRWTSNVNRQARSPTHLVAAPQDFDPNELKLQLSFKTEFVSPSSFAALSPSLDRLRLWFAYTQQSNWQVLNTRNSRPFRETNYEPEIILTYDNRARDGEARSAHRPDLVNLGVVHQSNGRSGEESRTWWRLYAQGGWQLSEHTAVLPRVWWALRESGMRADNPDISNYIGRGDIALRTDGALGEFLVLARHNLRASQSRGFYQVDWAPRFLKFEGTKFHVQLTSGYGESLLDYNHRQTTLGVGVSFWKW